MKTLLTFIGICITVAMVGVIIKALLIFCFKDYPQIAETIVFTTGMWCGMLFLTLQTKYL